MNCIISGLCTTVCMHVRTIGEYVRLCCAPFAGCFPTVHTVNHRYVVCTACGEAEEGWRVAFVLRAAQQSDALCSRQQSLSQRGCLVDNSQGVGSLPFYICTIRIMDVHMLGKVCCRCCERLHSFLCSFGSFPVRQLAVQSCPLTRQLFLCVCVCVCVQIAVSTPDVFDAAAAVEKTKYEVIRLSLTMLEIVWICDPFRSCSLSMPHVMPT